MEQIKTNRIKQAGKNISNIGYLIIYANMVAVIGIVHINSIEIDPNQISSETFPIVYGPYYFGYGGVYLLFHILCIVNIISAGDNLKNCDHEILATDVKDEQQVVYRETTNNITLKIISKNYKTIGAEVYINELPAPDGEYSYRNDNRKLYVKDGKIERMITI